MKLDEEVLRQRVAQIEEKIRGGAMLATAMNEVLKDDVEPMCADDVLFTHDTVRHMLEADGFKTGRIYKKDVLALGNQRRTKGRKTRRQEVAFDGLAGKEPQRHWLDRTEDRHEEIHSTFIPLGQQKAG